MGIHIRQEGYLPHNVMYWIVGVKELWKIKDKEKFDEVTSFLLKHNLVFGASYGEQELIINVSEPGKYSEFRTNDFEEFKKVVDKLIEYKKEFVTEASEGRK